MSSTMPPGNQFQALRPRRARVIDLMHPGEGTPWEDRGTTGLVVAFAQTCREGLLRPAKLLTAIRRPETSGDATRFCIGIGVVWMLSCLVHAALLYLRMSGRPDVEIDGVLFAVKTAAVALAALAAPWLFCAWGGGVFHKLVSAEDMKARAPQVLVYNIFCYCMAPGVLALLPLAGPPLAIVWIVALLIHAARVRLCVGTLGAIICTLIVALAALAALSAAALVAWKLSDWTIGHAWQHRPTRVPRT